MKYVLDTHVWIWWNMNPTKLSAKAASSIQNVSQEDEILLSAISIWEFCKLLEKDRITISCDPEEWIEEALDMPRLRIVPLSPGIAYHSTVLPEPFHDDPADQIITASTRIENAVIITKDKKIQAYKHVKSLW